MTLTAECLENLGLTAQPFAPGAREAFLYKDTLLDTQIERMLRALERPGAILLLSASSGAGRSTQLMRLLGALPSYFEIVAFRGRNNTTFASVDVTIRKHLAAQGDDNRDQPLNELLIERGRRGIDMLIAVDDAHLLGSGILRQLLKLGEDVSAASPIGPRLLLMGDAVLGRNYQRVLDTEDNRHVRHIGLLAFNQEQTADYLRHRLAAAGNADVAKLFKPEIVANLHRRSRGLPGELNAIAEEWLRDYCETLERKSQTATAAAEDNAEREEEPMEEESVDQHPIDEAPTDDEAKDPDEEAEPPQEPEATASQEPPPNQQEQPRSPSSPEPERRKTAVAFWKQPWFLPTATGAGLAVVILTIGLRMPEMTSDPSSPRLPPRQEGQAPATATDKPTTAAGPKDPPSGPETHGVTATPAGESGPEVGPEVGPGSDQLADSASVGETDPTSPTAPLADAPMAPPRDAPPDTTPDQPRQTPATTLADKNTPDGSQAQARHARPRTQTGTQTEDSAEQSASAERPATQPSPQQPRNAEPAQTRNRQDADGGTHQAPGETKRPGSTAPESPRTAASYDKAQTREDLLWLARQKPEHLTIQLIALKRFADVDKYLRVHGIDGASIIPNGPLVIAVYGSYPNMESAMAGLAGLPIAVITQGYWIRALGDVQKDARR